MAKKKLTDMQADFVEAYTATNNPRYAAAEAGFSSPEFAGYKMLKIPMIRDAVEARKMTRETLEGCAPAVVNEHVSRLLGLKGDTPTHREFGTLVQPYYKALGLGRDGDRTLADLDSAEMSGEQLRASLTVLETEAARLRERIASRAKLIEGEVVPDSAPDELDVFD